MKQRTQIQMRMDLLEVGEKMGWPRLGVAAGRRIMAGEWNWQRFAAKASIRELAPALRNASLLADYYGGGAAPAPVSTTAPPAAPITPDEKRQRQLESLAKARAARAAKRAQAQEAVA